MKYYEVYDAKSGKLLAKGPSWECKKKLGCASLGTFHALVSRSSRGINKKYIVKIINGGNTEYPILGEDDPIHKLGYMPTYSRNEAVSEGDIQDCRNAVG